jgi:hypothetical protein
MGLDPRTLLILPWTLLCVLVMAIYALPGEQRYAFYLVLIIAYLIMKGHRKWEMRKGWKK